MMGGTILVNSEIGIGTEFIVTLQFKICKRIKPFCVQKETDLETDNIESEMNIKGKKVLLVEESSVNDGINAVEIVANSVPGQYDLILMDIQMPLMDGYTATREIRTLSDPRIADIPIIALTANAFDTDKREALKAGMNGYIAKPVKIDKLMEMMKEVLS